MRRTRMLFAFLVLVLPSVRVLAQAPAEEGSYAPFTREEAAAVLEETAPVVARAAGVECRRLPGVELATEEQMAAVLRRDLEDGLKKYMPGPVDEETERRILAGLSRAAKRTLAHFDHRRHTILLLLSHFVEETVNLTPGERRRHLALILAHELVHALQHQVLGEAFYQPPDFIADLRVRQAVIEGHATSVACRAGVLLGVEQWLIDAALVISSEPDPAGGADSPPGVPIDPAVQYRDGGAFFDYHFQRGGNARLWQILAHPPTEYSMILHPETYSTVVSRARRLAQALSGILEKARIADWPSLLAYGDEWKNGTAFSAFSGTKEEEDLAGVRDGASVTAGRADGTASFNATLAVMTAPAAAVKLILRIAERRREFFRMEEQSGAVRIKELRFEEVKGIKLGAAWKWTCALTDPESEVEVRQTSVWVVKGDLLVEIDCANLPLEDAFLWHLAGEILGRLDRSK